jgi:hypothetical protein
VEAELVDGYLGGRDRHDSERINIMIDITDRSPNLRRSIPLGSCGKCFRDS